jgi:hypothetical protein
MYGRNKETNFVKTWRSIPASDGGQVIHTGKTDRWLGKFKMLTLRLSDKKTQRGQAIDGEAHVELMGLSVLPLIA